MQEKARKDSELMREFLIELRSGCTISEACRRLGINRDNELRSLRRKYPDFHAQLGAIRHGKDRAEKLASWTEAKDQWGSDFSDDARIEMFLLTYRGSGDRDAAATASGYLPTTVAEMLDPGSKKFHAEFSRAMREEELRRLWRIADDATRKAEMGDATMQRFILERRVGEYGSRARGETEANDHKFNTETLVKSMDRLRESLMKIRGEVGGAPDEKMVESEHGKAN